MSSVDLRRFCLVVPALNPNANLIYLLRELRRLGFSNIVLVNDGSDWEYQPIFEMARPEVSFVIHHRHNRGKGAALKTAFSTVLRHMSVDYVITLDADGQHLPEDVVSLAQATEHSKAPVLLGVRRFGDSVPFRSLFGNRLTQWFFCKLSGMHVSDTQTGLRLLSAQLLEELTTLAGERYEYEMHMLSYFARQNIDIREVQIKTVYIEGNSASHFRPLIDSARIYYVLFRDAIVSLSSFGLDLALFAILHALTQELFLSTCMARVTSAVYNFFGHKFFVFAGRHGKTMTTQIGQYVALVMCLLFASYLGVRLLSNQWMWNPVAAKVVVDFALYVSSFLVRRHIIFRLHRRR